MKRTLLAVSLTLVGSGVVYTVADAQRGSGGQHSPRYAVGSEPVRSFLPAVPAVPDEYAYGNTANDAVEMVLKVPAASDVWFNGTKTKRQTRAVRHFTTPELEPGQDYYYDITVRWTENGRLAEQKRRILVRAGDRLTLNFMDLPSGPASSTGSATLK
jgi:uncharacterized protein (TIGR03000 family)